MNKCPTCKQEIKEEPQILVKINGKPQRVTARKEIARRFKSGAVAYKEQDGKRYLYQPVPVIEVESK